MQKPSIKEENPPEPIKRVILTGLSDDELFGPAFLYEKQENFVEKKTKSANPVGIIRNIYTQPSDEEGDEYESEEEVQCTFCSQGVPAHYEDLHIDHMHPDELAIPYATEIPETTTSGDIKVK